jgi:3-isopropylmalate/(R)-2-methylmalate dehydratase small subunit
MRFRYLQALSAPERSFDIPSCSRGIRNTYKFASDPYRKHVLLEGLDDIGLTLKHEADITAFEQANHPSATMYEPVDAKYSAGR